MDISIYNHKFNLNKVCGSNYFEVMSKSMLDAASAHSDIISTGNEQLRTINLTWFMIQQRIEFLCDINKFDNIVVTTWPREKKGFFWPREYVVANDKGEKIAQATTLWGLFNTVERKISRADNVKYDITKFETSTCCLENLHRLTAFRTTNSLPITTIIPQISDIDENIHVNNTVYFRWLSNIAIDVLNISPEQLFAIEVKYVNQVYIKDSLNIFIDEREDGIYIEAQNKIDSQLKFLAQIQLINRQKK